MDTPKIHDPTRSGLAAVNRSIDGVLRQLEQITMAVAVAALFAIMVLIFVDGSLRYIANAPLKFATDVVILYLISAGFLLVLSYTLREGGHISVDVFTSLFPPRLERFLVSSAYLASIPFIWIMASEMTRSSWESYTHGEVLIGLYAMPIWLSKAIVALSLVMLNLRLLHIGCFNFLSAVLNREDLVVRIEHMVDHPEEEGV
jgi:TRAP-type C4-dicarboxylate transport system permease small subunit